MKKICRYARTETDLRELQHAAAAAFEYGDDLHLRVHILSLMRGKYFAERLPELRWRILSTTGPPKEKLERCNYLGAFPASTTVRNRPVDSETHERFAKVIQRIPPEQR